MRVIKVPGPASHLGGGEGQSARAPLINLLRVSGLQSHGYLSRPSRRTGKWSSYLNDTDPLALITCCWLVGCADLDRSHVPFGSRG